MSEFKVDSAVDMPVTRNRTAVKYPFATMQVGDSFEITDNKVAKTVSTSASSYGKRHGVKFSVRKVSDGLWRCWRVPTVVESVAVDAVKAEETPDQ